MSEPVYEVFGYLSARQYIKSYEINYYSWSYRGYTLEVTRDTFLGFLTGSINLADCPFDFGEAVEIADNKLRNGALVNTHKGEMDDGDRWIGMSCDGLQDIRPYSLHYPTSQRSSKSYKTFEYVKRNLEQTVDKILEELWC